MNLTHIVDNKRIAKNNSYLEHTLKYKDPCVALIHLVEDELEFTQLSDYRFQYKVRYAHNLIPHLFIHIDYNEAILHIFYKEELKDTITIVDRYPYYKINETNQNYEETFNYIINKIREVWDATNNNRS
jgi:hypothetical protein